MQVDLGAEISVGGIATQGRNQNFEQWVTAYKLEYSNDEISFLPYKDPGSSADKVKLWLDSHFLSRLEKTVREENKILLTTFKQNK